MHALVGWEVQGFDNLLLSKESNQPEEDNNIQTFLDASVAEATLRAYQKELPHFAN